MSKSLPVSPAPTVILNGLPSRRGGGDEVAVILPLLVVSNRRMLALAIDRIAAQDLVRRIGVFLDDLNRSRETRCAMPVTGVVGGKERTVSLVLPRVAAALLSARLDYLGSGAALKGDPRALDP